LSVLGDVLYTRTYKRPLIRAKKNWLRVYDDTQIVNAQLVFQVFRKTQVIIKTADIAILDLIFMSEPTTDTYLLFCFRIEIFRKFQLKLVLGQKQNIYR